jgi:integrase
MDWPVTQRSRQDVEQLLSCPPFQAATAGKTSFRQGIAILLDWLENQQGATWQQRWRASGIEQAGNAWRPVIGQWLQGRGLNPGWRVRAVGPALGTVIAADVLRPSMCWLVAVSQNGRGVLSECMARGRDPVGFTRLRELGESTEHLRPDDATAALARAAIILGAKGGSLADITVGDVLELFDVQAQVLATMPSGTTAFYQLLHQLGGLGPGAPETLREVRLLQQRPPEELIDRYGLLSPIRDLLVDYLRERQAAVDYTSLKMLSYYLGKCFWRDIERHHPEVEDLRLTPEVTEAWKKRLQARTKTVTGPSGQKTDVVVERICYRDCLTAVRAFYLDIAQWAVEDPDRWGPWVAPCPIRETEVARSKFARQRKARIDGRTRERLPVLPVLVRTVDQRRKNTAALLETARQTAPGQTITTSPRTLVRAVAPTATTSKLWAEEPATGTRRDLGLEEERAFWTWAAIEVLRATGIRVEELLELSHHSLIQYRLPTTGEVVPLLQIAPSKTDTERLVLISPELADVLSTIICRVRDPSGAIPLIRAYDRRENRWQEPAPLLFQRRVRTENRPIRDETIRDWLSQALAGTGLTDPATGNPLSYTPHDFRRLFITDAIMGGLPPHIAQIVAGHQDINVTLGYKAIYPEEAIQAHRSFLARRRSIRPSEEYRTPTDAEWEQFLGHFERRKVSIGSCGRAFGTPCIHEHACIRCSMLWPDPAQRDRLTEIRDSLINRIAEAEREGWLGEVEGLTISLAGAEQKLAQLDQRPSEKLTVTLGLPSFPRDSQGTKTVSKDEKTCRG